MMNLLRLFESTFATYSGITTSGISSTYSKYMSPGPYKLYITLYYRNYGNLLFTNKTCYYFRKGKENQMNMNEIPLYKETTSLSNRKYFTSTLLLNLKIKMLNKYSLKKMTF